ncbi:cobyrinic acid a,c-diamide synthase [Aureimonas endophytica]|uniref:Cobyrinic acid a,c-diamide synthase n=1 Tax=Aureimonas endophytica TaxID=2027858 RepID=A0A917A4L9_9HYPH|nr:AAA family ATPase [Aureimonas endophytica]GGE24830.1 cobyrinic acid a,c-diamide synthase [Aureimonas endophytica]
MRTIAFASRKGGAGKSTLAAHLSTLADAEAFPAVLIDIDPQGSLTFWHSLRSAETPVLVTTTAKDLPRIMKDAEADEVKWCFIDGPPHDSEAIAAMMRAADLTIIPTRPSAFDLAAVSATLDMVKAVRKPHLAVINAAPAPRGFGEPTVTAEARGVLSEMGATVWPGAIVQRAALAHAIAGGMSVGELEPEGAADREMKRLWRDVRETLENTK